MKKRLLSLLCLLLAMTMLAGCAARPVSLAETLREKLAELAERIAAGDEIRNPQRLKFSEIPYERADMDAFAADIEAVKTALDDGAALAEVEALLDRCMDDYDHFYTMYNLANICNSRDLRDEYYAAEFEWYGSQDSVVLKLFDELYYACSLSPLGAELEGDYFWEGFCEEYDDPAESKYRDETVALMQRESELISRYRELVADPVVDYRGEERSVYELLDELSGLSYLAVLQSYHEKYNEQLAEVYIDLMRVHGEMAEAMGYSCAEDMQYDYYFERDYTPEEAAVFIGNVKEYIVPLSVWADERQLDYRAGASPMSRDELYDALRRVAKDIGGDCAEAFDFMSRYEFYDIEPDVYKADTSFEIYLSEYDSPFIFLNPTGTSEDLLTFVHEFGHYTDAYVNFNANESLDLAECFSQGLEYLSLGHMSGFLDEEEIEALRLGLMLDAMSNFVQQCAFASFESKAHALGPDALDAETLNALALQSAKDFGFCPAGYEGLFQYFWMDIPHLFEYPFYVISYPVSLDIALQLYELELEEEGKGLEKYFEILPRDYDSFMETVEMGGLTNPFAEGGLRRAAAAIAESIGYDGPLAQAA